MRYRRMISAVLVPATLLLFAGCSKTEWIRPEEFRPKDKVTGVVTAERQEVKFDRAVFSGDTIYAYAGADAFKLTLREVERVGVQRLNPTATAAVVLGGLVVVGLAAAAIAAHLAVSAWSDSDSSLEY